jgi:hypothetical protein
MTIYGRNSLVEALVRIRAPIVLLTGDSGVGKSTVLAAAQQATPDALAPPPLTVSYSGGALQQALLITLADAVAAYVSAKGRAREIAGYLVEVADRLAREGAQELAKVIGKELLALVRGRVGDDVGKAFGEYVEELKSTVDERLAVRLTAAVDPGVAGMILDFATEVCAFVGDQRVVLALDAGERLREEDVRLLADLAEQLPDQLQLRIAFSTYTAAHRERVEFLLGSSTSVTELRVPGLDVVDIASWLADEGLDPAAASDVARVTGGYALHVGDLVMHLRQGGSIQDGPINELFGRRTIEAWRSLPSEIARHARALCVFVDPLPRDRMLTFLGLDATAWGEVEERLWRTRLFSVEVNGQRWFHEQRRRYVLQEVLGAAERADVSARAAQELHDLVTRDGAVERLGELASAVAASTLLLQADSRLAAVIALEHDELAVVASLIELFVPTSIQGAGGYALLKYASSVFGAKGDLVEVLRRLEQRDLIVLQLGQATTVVAPNWQSGLVTTTISGRAVKELGRLPVPYAASVVFESEVQPRLGPFTKAHYGLGHPSPGKLSEMAMELRRPEPPVIGRPKPGSNLLIRGKYAGRDIYAAVTFASAADRDAACEALDGLSGEIFRQRFEINDLQSHPVDPIPSRRFLEAAERLTGERLGGPVSSSFIRLPLNQPIPVEEALRRKATAIRMIRDRSSEVERMAAQLDEPMGYAFYEQDDWFLEMEIQGGRDDVRRLQSLPFNLRWDDPYQIIRLTQLLNLGPNEHIDHWNFRGGMPSTDPVVEILARLHTHAARFNRHQGRRRRVLLEQDSLQTILNEAAKRNLADAHALAPAIPVGDKPDPLESRITYLFIELNPPTPGWVAGANSVVTYVFVPNPGGEEEVQVALTHRNPSAEERTLGFTPMAERFGLDGDARDYIHGYGDLRDAVASMLGHMESELEFAYPAEG